MSEPNEQVHSMIEGSWKARALRAEAENVRLREALRFYADPETYIEGDWPPGAIDGEIPIEKDQGAVARATLDGEDTA